MDNNVNKGSQQQEVLILMKVSHTSKRTNTSEAEDVPPDYPTGDQRLRSLDVKV